jgi:hypothetical protein
VLLWLTEGAAEGIGEPVAIDPGLGHRCRASEPGWFDLFRPALAMMNPRCAKDDLDPLENPARARDRPNLFRFHAVINSRFGVVTGFGIATGCEVTGWRLRRWGG